HGPDAAGFTAPFTITESVADVCPMLADQGDEPCDGHGQRLQIELDSPDAPPARLLDGTAGQAGAGYWVMANHLQQWTAKCQHHTRRDVLIVRQDCAPDCGPPTVVDVCLPDEDL